MHGINKHQSTHRVREPRNFGDGIDGTDHIGGVPHGNQFRFRGNLALQIIHIQRAIRFANVHLLNGHAFFFQRTPGRHVGVVVQRGDHDFIAGF